MISVRGWLDARAIKCGQVGHLKISNDPNGNRTWNLPCCAAVPQPTAPPGTRNLNKWLVISCFAPPPSPSLCVSTVEMRYRHRPSSAVFHIRRHVTDCP
jgi:hypothetical protein